MAACGGDAMTHNIKWSCISQVNLAFVITREQSLKEIESH